MLSNDATIIKIKHEVYYQVAKLAFEGTFDEKKDDIPYNMIPGPKAQFRCCIYKEREIIRQRIRLAEGLNPTDSDSDNIIQVINSACEECPIARYTVTDNCRLCMMKACKQACKFGAVSMGRDCAYIDPQKCRECGQCAKACPYNAIADLIRPCMKTCPVGAIEMDEYGVSKIDESKCIECGKCIHSCPFGAIGSKAYIVDVINAIRAGKHVYAMIAPASEGQFGADITMASWRTALKKVGFSDLYEVGLGGDMTAYSEAKEWLEAYRDGKKMTTSCCPAFVNMVKKHFPELMENVSTTVSPMCAVSRMIKAKDEGAITVFIGPCVAKKSESKDKSIKGNADYVLTFGEIRAILRAKDVVLEPEEDDRQEASVFGKRFGNGGGVTAAVLESMKEMGQETDVKVAKCSGAAECKKILTLFKFGKLPEDFIEGMACEGGCVGGPSAHRAELPSRKDRDTLIAQADSRNIEQNLAGYDMDSFSMHR